MVCLFKLVLQIKCAFLKHDSSLYQSSHRNKPAGMKDISTQKGKGCSCKISKFKITLVHLIFGGFHRMSPLIAITGINFQNLSILQFIQWVLIAHNLCSTNGAACKLWNSEGKRKLFLVMGVFSQEQNSQAKNKMGLSMGTYFPDN